MIHNAGAADFVGAEPERVLKAVFGYDFFRPFQKEIIASVLAGKDTLAVMPTGGGKSLCCQIPALIFDGLTIVVSPLIALMQDQVSALAENGVSAVFLNSTLEWDDYRKASDDGALKRFVLFRRRQSELRYDRRSALYQRVGARFPSRLSRTRFRAASLFRCRVPCADGDCNGFRASRYY